MCCTTTTALSANVGSYLDNSLVGGQDSVHLHFGPSLLQVQQFIGFGGHGVAAGTRGQCLGQAGGICAALQERINLQEQRMWKEIKFS